MKRRHLGRTVQPSDFQVVAASEMPRLIATQPVPRRDLAPRQQKINHGESIAPVCSGGYDPLRTAKDLAKITAFRMRYESKFANQLFGFRVHAPVP